MNILRYLWLGGVLGVLFSVSLLVPLSSAEANPEPGKVTFKSAHTNYEYEVGKDAVNILTTTTASQQATTATTFRPRLIYPGWTPQNLTQEPSPPTSLSKGSTNTKYKRRKRSNNDKGSNGQESRRISIAIRPMAAASEQTDVEVKVKKTMVSSSEDEDTNSRSNEVTIDRTNTEEEDDELEQRKRDCRGLPWPFVNALNATNCLDLDSEEFQARLISKEAGDEDDEEDSTVVLPKKKSKGKKAARGGGRRKQPREEDYDEDYPSDPLPQARTYHEYAMMLRDMAIPDGDGVPPYLRGPSTYQDFYNRQYRKPYEDQSDSSHTGWGWGWTTTPPPSNGWGQSTAQPAYGNQRQPHELKNSFGQPSQTQQGNGQPVSFGQPSNPQQGPQGKQLTFGQPAPLQQQPQQLTFGQPATTTQNQTASPPQQSSGNRQGKALEFGQPSQQQLQIPAPQNLVQAPVQQQSQQQFQQRTGYLAPAYYAPPATTPAPYYGYSQQSNNGWGETTTQSNGWTQESTTQSNGWGQTTTTTTTPPPDYKRPPYQQQNQPSPTVYPIYQTNQTQTAPPQQAQQSNGTQVMEMYNRLLNLYRLLINDTSNQQQAPQSSPPAYQQPNPWQVPPPPQTWSGAFGANRQFDDYYPQEILPGIVDSDPYLYDPLDQPKLLPRPISPVGRRNRQFRRRNFRTLDAEDRIGREREPRVRYMNEEPAVLHEIDNKETFLPRRKYFKRKINEEDFKSVSGDKDKKTKKKKKDGKRRWGSSSRYDDEYDDYDMDSYSNQRYKHPDVPPWLRYADTYDYQPPVYGPPPPAESGGGWGQPTPPPPQSGWTEAPPQSGWGWEQTTTQQPGWGWEQTTTTEKPGWGWGEESTTTTTTTTTEAPPPESQGEQQENVTTTEEGPGPGQQWNPPQDSQAYLQQQLLQLQQQLLQQLAANGQLPPEYQQQLQQQQQQQLQRQQQQQQKQPVQQQYPILQPTFGTQGQFSAQPIQQPAPIPQQIQQQSGNGTAGALDPVIEDIGRNDPTEPTPQFRDQPPNINQGLRVANARQLFDGEEGGRSVVQTVTSTSVSESTATGEEKGAADKGNENQASAVQVQPGQVQQVSPNSNNTTPGSSALGQNVYSAGGSIPAARQLRYLTSSTAAGSPVGGTASIQPRRAPSWGNWGGSLSPTYSKVQNAQPYRIMKRINDREEMEGHALGLIETQLGDAKKLDVGDDEENRPSLLRRVVD